MGLRQAKPWRSNLESEVFRTQEQCTRRHQGAEGVEASVRIAPWRGTPSDAKSGRNVRSTLRPDSRLTFCALGAPDAQGAPDAKYYFCWCKIFALCDHDYTYGFLWYSSTEGIAELSSAPPNLSPTLRGVLQLAQLLPSHHRWNLLLDNHFTNIPLFERLLELGIGAAGTTRVNCAGFPSTLKIKKEEARKVLPWGHVSGEVVGNVCCLVWQDNSSVLFISSYHDIKKKVERLRRWPKKTSTNATVVRDIFQDQSRKVLPISGFIDDYNYHMDSVDIADQLRSYYTIQQKCHRNWFPLFYWLLDTSLVNTYQIQKTLNTTGYRKLQS